MSGLGLFSECLGPTETSKCTMKADRGQEGGQRGTSRPFSELTLALQDVRGHPMGQPHGPCQPKSWRLARGRVKGSLTMPSDGRPMTRPHAGLSLPGTKMPRSCLSVLQTSPWPLAQWHEALCPTGICYGCSSLPRLPPSGTTGLILLEHFYAHIPHL